MSRVSGRIGRSWLLKMRRLDPCFGKVYRPWAGGRNRVPVTVHVAFKTGGGAYGGLTSSTPAERICRARAGHLASRRPFITAAPSSSKDAWPGSPERRWVPLPARLVGGFGR
jgi:hypothetical protein